MTQAIQIHKVGAKQISQVIELLRKSIDVDEVKTFKLLESRIESDQHLMLLAKSDTEPVGVLECSVMKYNALTGGVDRGVVHTIYVDDAHRRKGIGSAMMKTAGYWFSSANVDWIVTEVPLQDENFQAFFKSLDYDPYTVMLIKKASEL